MRLSSLKSAFTALIIVLMSSGLASGAVAKKKTTAKKTSTSKQVIRKASSKKARVATSKKRRGRGGTLPGSAFVASGPWREPTFADSTEGDNVNGEDLTVRRAAVEALGPYNGSVVVVDPTTGRVLTMVNQKTALKSGFQPCSTIKIVASLAGLAEGVIDRETNMHLYGRVSMNLTNALAHSNNNYFANIGVKLGFEKVNYYSRLLGLGEKAGLNIEGEQPGTLPDGPPKFGGMGMMMSFGEGIQLTPLQLAAMISAISNGGTLYYLQHPTSEAEVQHFVPRVKRNLTIQQHFDDLRPGMAGAVEFGTARRASYDPSEPIFGKTGTCTDRATPTHLGWFGSYNEVAGRKLVVVVLLTGGRQTSGPIASGIAGQVYKTLSMKKYYAQGQKTVSPVALVSPSPW